MLRKEIILYATILLTTFSHKTCSNMEKKYQEGITAALTTFSNLNKLFIYCVQSPKTDNYFAIDDLKSFVNYPPKTTVGFAPRFTNNRKFFANMLRSSVYKDMVAKDEEILRKNWIKKLRYCDGVIMDENILKEFYDREVDLTKLK